MSWDVIVSLIVSLGGFSFIQWIFNRKNEKNSNIVDNNTKQFDLFEKMNDYLDDKFSTFQQIDEKKIKENRRISKSVAIIRKNQIKEQADIRDLHKQTLRLQILQLIDHSPEMSEDINKLYEEYKSKGGNSYIDKKMSKYKEDYGKI